MSQAQHLPFISGLNPGGGVEALLAHQLHSHLRDEDVVLQFENAPQFLVGPDAGQVSFDLFRSDVSHKVFRHGSVDDIQLRYAICHDACPQPKAASLDHFQIRTNGKQIRFRAAPLAFNSKAADRRGIPSAASVHHSEGRRCNHHNSIHAKAIASATPHPRASRNLALSDIQNSFGFAPRRTHSSKSRLQTSAPTVVASNSVAPHSRANAGHRGCVVGQQ